MITKCRKPTKAENLSPQHSWVKLPLVEGICTTSESRHFCRIAQEFPKLGAPVGVALEEVLLENDNVLEKVHFKIIRSLRNHEASETQNGRNTNLTVQVQKRHRTHQTTIKINKTILASRFDSITLGGF